MYQTVRCFSSAVCITDWWRLSPVHCSATLPPKIVTTQIGFTGARALLRSWSLRKEKHAEFVGENTHSDTQTRTLAASHSLGQPSGRFQVPQEGSGSRWGVGGTESWTPELAGHIPDFHRPAVLLQPQLLRWQFPTPLPSIVGLLLWQDVSRQPPAPSQPGLPAAHV